MRLSKLLSFCLLLTWTVRAQNSSSIAAVNGTKLYYEVAGRGEALVFIHSIALDTRVWDAQWSVFSKKFRAIRYDVRGYGQSGRAHDPHDPTEDLKALLDYLKVEKAHLVGQGMGGNIALNFAAKYPDRVLKIISVDTTLDGFADYTADFNATLNQIVDLASHRGWHDEEQAVWLRSPLTRLYTADDRAIINLSEIIADYHGDHFINPRINPDFGSPSTLQLLSKIQSPLLILVGEKDEESMHRIAKILETQIPYSQKRIIKGAGHLSNMDKPKIFNHLALSFLRKKP